MKTLYDLLGALPNDNAEGLRTAFRRAVKGAHPDIRPGDPDAPQRFRQIVIANEILGDAEQRAAYDDLLEHARLEQETASRYSLAARIQKLASGVIALSGASVVSVGGYLLLMHMSAASVVSANSGEVTTHASHQIAAAMPQSTAASVTAASTSTVAARFQAILPDPKLLPATIDHGILFYPTQKIHHVFPDIAPAKRIEKARSPAPTVTRSPPLDQVATVPSTRPLYFRRTADPSRQEGFASAMLR
jgi:hypothetical protein